MSEVFKPSRASLEALNRLKDISQMTFQRGEGTNPSHYRVGSSDLREVITLVDDLRDTLESLQRDLMYARGEISGQSTVIKEIAQALALRVSQREPEISLS